MANSVYRFISISLAILLSSIVVLWTVRSMNKVKALSFSAILYEVGIVTKPILAKVILPASVNNSNDSFHCKSANLINMTFPVCLYDAKSDSVLSGPLLRDGTYFESREVKSFLQLLRSDQRLQLVDIGANVGIWSLPAARLTQVLSVEPNWRSISRLAKAVDLGSVASNITLVHNAVSDVRTTLNMGVHPTNQGDAFLINATKCTKTPTRYLCNTIPAVDTILFDDLLPLMRSRSALVKVDVQGHEVKIFTDSSASQFFDHVDVPLVFMEWVLCKRHSSKLVRRLLNFFYARNYAAFDLHNFKLKKQYRSWPWNVLFKKPPYIRFYMQDMIRPYNCRFWSAISVPGFDFRSRDYLKVAKIRNVISDGPFLI